MVGSPRPPHLSNPCIQVSTTKKYRVWIKQINTSIVEVKAKDRDEAMEKAARKWKREVSGRPEYVEERTKEKP